MGKQSCDQHFLLNYIKFLSSIKLRIVDVKSDWLIYTSEITFSIFNVQESVSVTPIKASSVYMNVRKQINVCWIVVSLEISRQTMKISNSLENIL